MGFKNREIFYEPSERKIRKILLKNLSNSRAFRELIRRVMLKTDTSSEISRTPNLFKSLLADQKKQKNFRGENS